jgi:hypothetical protein
MRRSVVSCDNRRLRVGICLLLSMQLSSRRWDRHGQIRRSQGFGCRDPGYPFRDSGGGRSAIAKATIQRSDGVGAS